jgi:hypothetical protein
MAVQKMDRMIFITTGGALGEQAYAKKGSKGGSPHYWHKTELKKGNGIFSKDAGGLA